MPDMPLEAVPVGAMLSRPVYGPGGVLIAAAGTCLTPTHLNLLQTRGVRRVMVAGAETGALYERTHSFLLNADEIRARVTRRFAPAEPLSPFMRAVQSASEHVLVARAERLQGDVLDGPLEGRR